MRADCDICGGRGKIRLPVMHKLSMRAYNAKIEMHESSREYACPECSEAADDNRVMVAGAMEMTRLDLADEPQYAEHCKRAMVHRIADLLIRDGFVRFVDGATDKMMRTKELRAYVGVVAVGAAKRIEDRINERQWEMAEKVIQEAADAVQNWGSHYTGRAGPINKSDAVRQIFDALKMAKAKPA
jgi:hypothetical protein